MDHILGWIMFLFMIITGSISFIQAEDPTYAVIVPSNMRPNRQFDVSIQTFGNKGEFDVTAKMLNMKEKPFVSVDRTFKGDTQYTLSMKIPAKNLESEHVFSIKATGAVSFENETTIRVSFKSVTILIQTDKAIYKPGQKVLFRCMAVFSDLKPYLGKFDIEITDTSDNKMAEWNNVKDSSGVYSGEFQLASAPVLGEWTIKVTVKTGEFTTKVFLIDEFVLPKVEAKVELPSFLHKSRLPLVATVSAQYTFGQPLSGKAVVTIKSTRQNRFNNKTYPSLTRTVKLKNGKKDVVFTADDLRMLYKCVFSWCANQKIDTLDRLMFNTLNITAVITDDVTGDEWFAGNTIFFDRSLHRLKFLENTPETFKDGLVWTGFMQLTMPDGSPPLEKDIKDELLNVTYKFEGFKEEGRREYTITETVERRYPIPNSGIIVIDVEVPKLMTECRITARFQSDPNIISAFKTIEKFVSRDEQGLQISLPDLDGPIEPSVTPVRFVLNSTDPVDKFYYQLLSKGSIIITGNGMGSGTVNEFTIVFDSKLAQKSAPSARLVVWYITDEGEVIVDSVEFSVKGAFANEVTVSFSKDEVEPRDEVSVTVTSHKGSFVGLLAVDQSVLLLKGGNDITQQEVLDDLQKYDSNNRPLPRPRPIGKRRRKRSICFFCYFPRTSGGKDAKEVFENSGVKIMTNAHIHEAPTFNGKRSDNPNDPNWVPTIFTFTPKENSRRSVAKKQRDERHEKFNSRRSLTYSRNIKDSANNVDQVCDTDPTVYASVCNETNSTGTQFDNYDDPALLEIINLKQKNHNLDMELRERNNEIYQLREENEKLKSKCNSFTFNNIRNSDSWINFFTGLGSLAVFMWVVNRIKDKVSLCNNRLSIEDHVLIVFMKLRLGLLSKDIAHRFGIQISTVSNIYRTWLPVLSSKLQNLIVWPDKGTVRKNLPISFKSKFRDAICTIDCSEIYIERPSSLTSRAQTWSNYKHHNTIKYLIGVSPAGAVIFLSSGWGGRVSDKHITLESGFLNKITPGDCILADRGFLIRKEVNEHGGILKIPSFTKGKKQLPAKDVDESRQLARNRIHVERVIGRLKVYRMIQTIIPISQVDLLDYAMVVISASINLNRSVVPIKQGKK